MKKLSNFAAICAASLFVSVCAGLMTAGPTMAQAGRPPADVNVVNTPDVNVVGLPAVQIDGTPTVNVSSLPAVQVSELPAVQVSQLPAVQVGNGAESPIPVQVMNPSGGPGVLEPVLANAFPSMAGNETSKHTDIYTVPADKWLIVEQVTFNTQEDNRFPCRYALNVRNQQGQVRSFTMAVDDRVFDQLNVFMQYGTEQVQIYAAPGTLVSWFMGRSSTGVGAGGGVSISGRLVPAS